MGSKDQGVVHICRLYTPKVRGIPSQAYRVKHCKAWLVARLGNGLPGLHSTASRWPGYGGMLDSGGSGGEYSRLLVYWRVWRLATGEACCWLAAATMSRTFFTAEGCGGMRQDGQTRMFGWCFACGTCMWMGATLVRHLTAFVPASPCSLNDLFVLEPV
jgi:hypothetical protein